MLTRFHVKPPLSATETQAIIRSGISTLAEPLPRVTLFGRSKVVLFGGNEFSMWGDAAVLCLRQCVPRETTGTERQGGSYGHGDSPLAQVAVVRGFT